MHYTLVLLWLNLENVCKSRESIVRSYWQHLAGLSATQFRKTIFIKTEGKKIYKNFHEHFDVLTVYAKKSSDLQYQVLGLSYGVLRRFGAKAAM